MTIKENEKDIKKLINYLFLHELSHYVASLKPNGCKNHIFNSLARLHREYYGSIYCLNCGFMSTASIDGYFCKSCVENDFGLKLDKKGRYIID